MNNYTFKITPDPAVAPRPGLFGPFCPPPKPVPAPPPPQSPFAAPGPPLMPEPMMPGPIMPEPMMPGPIMPEPMMPGPMMPGPMPCPGMGPYPMPPLPQPIYPPMPGMPGRLAHSYVPWQNYNVVYNPAEALANGTLFPELNMPQGTYGPCEGPEPCRLVFAGGGAPYGC